MLQYHISKTNVRQPDAIKLFWDRYIQPLSSKRLANHSAKDVIDYLEVLSKNIKIKDWQFRQAVDAIQNLFTMLEVPWLNEVVAEYKKTAGCLFLTTPAIGVLEHGEPGRGGEIFHIIGQPMGLPGQEGSLRMGHHGEMTAVRGAESGNPPG